MNYYILPVKGLYGFDTMEASEERMNCNSTQKTWMSIQAFLFFRYWTYNCTI